MEVVEEFLFDLVRVTPQVQPTRSTAMIVEVDAALGTALATRDAKLVQDRVWLVGQPRGNQTSRATMVDVARLRDALTLVAGEALAESLSLADTHKVIIATQLLDRLGIRDLPILRGSVNLTAAEAVRFVDEMALFLGASAADTLGAAAAMRLALTVKASETAQLTTTPRAQLLVRVDLDDSVTLSAAQLLRLLARAELIESVELSAGFLSEDGSFTTWVMNTRTGAVSEYSDFVFNSFAQVGSTAIAASSEGLFELVGDTDAGSDIVARIRSGFLQFGGTRLSRLKAAYIAMRGEGEILLKIEEAGDKTYIYRADTRNMRSTKVHMGKGQRARYFAFELTTSGQDFDLDSIEFVPIVVQRRV